jgi:hypothetical protein
LQGEGYCLRARFAHPEAELGAVGELATADRDDPLPRLIDARGMVVDAGVAAARVSSSPPHAAQRGRRRGKEENRRQEPEKY